MNIYKMLFRKNQQLDVKDASTSNFTAGTDGISDELFKAGSDELIWCMHQLINKIWLVECMLEECSLSIFCPIFKKVTPQSAQTIGHQSYFSLV